MHCLGLGFFIRLSQIASKETEHVVTRSMWFVHHRFDCKSTLRYLGECSSVRIVPEDQSKTRPKGGVIYYQLGGGRYIQGGRNFFVDALGGGSENKMALGQGGSCISSGIWGGGVRCVPLVLHFIKSHSFWGLCPPDPPLSHLYTVILSGPMGRHSNQQSNI